MRLLIELVILTGLPALVFLVGVSSDQPGTDAIGGVAGAIVVFFVVGAIEIAFEVAFKLL